MKKIKVCGNWSFCKTFIREHSSKDWLLRQKTDPYIEKAKINNYRYFHFHENLIKIITYNTYTHFIMFRIEFINITMLNKIFLHLNLGVGVHLNYCKWMTDFLY